MITASEIIGITILMEVMLFLSGLFPLKKPHYDGVLFRMNTTLDTAIKQLRRYRMDTDRYGKKVTTSFMEEIEILLTELRNKIQRLKARNNVLKKKLKDLEAKNHDLERRLGIIRSVGGTVKISSDGGM